MIHTELLCANNVESDSLSLHPHAQLSHVVYLFVKFFCELISILFRQTILHQYSHTQLTFTHTAMCSYFKWCPAFPTEALIIIQMPTLLYESTFHQVWACISYNHSKIMLIYVAESRNQLPILTKWQGCSIPRVLFVTSVLDYRVSNPLHLSLWNVDWAIALDFGKNHRNHMRDIVVLKPWYYPIHIWGLSWVFMILINACRSSRLSFILYMFHIQISETKNQWGKTIGG